MIVRHFNEIEQSSRAVHAQNWSSFRLLTRDDGMGFSLHETLVNTEGVGDGKPFAIKAGMLYALNANDRHLLRAFSRLRLVCVFNPPLRGDEQHDADGAYAPASDTIIEEQVA